MSVYLGIMAREYGEARWKCKDQAMHIHLFHSSILGEELKWNGFGGVELASQKNAVHVGSAGTTPLVRTNEVGEILKNENREVLAVVHQYIRHEKLERIVEGRYCWVALVG
jgi:hypothetical protein